MKYVTKIIANYACLADKDFLSKITDPVQQKSDNLILESKPFYAYVLYKTYSL